MFFRLRKSIEYAHFRFETRALARSRGIPCNPAAGCEVHTMLSSGDVPLYLVAIKSLLRFFTDIAVVVHSDGSLSAHDIRLLERHVPGVRLVDPVAADELAARSLSSELADWRRHDASFRRLMDTALWSRTRKRLILDADMLVVRRPDELIEWTQQSGSPVLLGGEEPGTSSPPPAGHGHIQTVFRYHLEEIARRMGRPAAFLQGTTSGLYGCSDELGFDVIERLLRVCGEIGVPMREWGGEQCTVIYLLSSAGGRPLNPRAYLNFGPEQVGKVPTAAIVHFFGTYRFYQGVYRRAARKVVEALA